MFKVKFILTFCPHIFCNGYRLFLINSCIPTIITNTLKFSKGYISLCIGKSMLHWNICKTYRCLSCKSNVIFITTTNRIIKCNINITITYQLLHCFSSISCTICWVTCRKSNFLTLFTINCYGIKPRSNRRVCNRRFRISIILLINGEFCNQWP